MENKDKKFYIKIAVMLAVAAFLLVKNPKSTGRVYAPDMGFSTAYETYGEGPIGTLFNGTKVFMEALLPVQNTINQGTLPDDSIYRKDPSTLYSYQYTKYFKNSDTDKVKAGNMLKNPYMQTAEVLKRGEVVYTNQCAVCHGKTGMGDGPLVVREDGSDPAYKAVPPAYSDRLKTLKDGEIFHSISYGKNMMGGYASHVSPDDRWKLVCYIKSLGGIKDGQAVNAGMDTTSTKQVAIK